MKKTMFVGVSGSGKTTLIQRLQDKVLEARKTQMVEYHLHFIDTPGEYLERRGMYRAIIVTAADADMIGFVQECGVPNTWLPPAFASTFPKPVIGIITKADLAKSEDDIEHAREILLQAGVQRVFVVSSVENTGISELLDFLGNM